MSGKSILVVDDDPMVRESIEMMLELDGHKIQLVGSGAEALEQYVPGRYDVVLTDNRMPGMSGVELAEKIKTRNPSQTIVLFSGSPPLGPTPSCQMVLLKPFSASDLRRAILRAAEGAKASVPSHV